MPEGSGENRGTTTGRQSWAARGEPRNEIVDVTVRDDVLQFRQSDTLWLSGGSNSGSAAAQPRLAYDRPCAHEGVLESLRSRYRNGDTPGFGRGRAVWVSTTLQPTVRRVEDCPADNDTTNDSEDCDNNMTETPPNEDGGSARESASDGKSTGGTETADTDGSPEGDGAGSDSSPGEGVGPQEITPGAPEDFGLVQVFWGDGKGKTTSAMGMGMRAVGHGYRVHMLQFMKGGAGSVEDIRGEYNAITALPGYSYENSGHYGWHGMSDGTDDTDHENHARAGLDRVEEILDGAREADLTTPFDPDGPPEDGVHMLILDEICYAANRDLIDPGAVVELVESKPDGLELVLTGGHDRPTYLVDCADLVTNVRKEKHPIEAGQSARRGTEY